MTTVKSYLKFIPILIIPLAGLIFMMTIAPYFAVNKGCQSFGKNQRGKRNELALTFSILISTFLSGLLIVVGYFLAPSFTIQAFELTIIIIIYASMTIFSLFGSR